MGTHVGMDLGNGFTCDEHYVVLVDQNAKSNDGETMKNRCYSAVSALERISGMKWEACTELVADACFDAGLHSAFMALMHDLNHGRSDRRWR